MSSRTAVPLVLFMHFFPGLDPPCPSAPSLAFPELPAHGPHVTWALVPLGAHLGMVYSLVCLPWWTRANEGGAWSLLNRQDQEQGLAHSWC